MHRPLLILLTLALGSRLITGVDPTMAQEASTLEAQPGRLAAEDTLRIGNVGSPRISPDGEWVLYTVATRDMADDDMPRRTHLYRVRVDGTEGRQLTRGESSATSPQWFPSGDRFAFRRGDDDSSQVYAMYTDGGEAWQVTESDEGVASYGLSPDGTKVWFVARDPETVEQKRRAKQHDDAIVVDASYRFSHLWVHDMVADESTRLSEGDFTVADPRWSPDSSRIAFVTRPTTKANDGWNSDIRVADVATGASRLLFENPGPDSAPRWSPDGETIALVANTHAGRTVWHSKLYLLPSDGGAEPEILLEDFDLNAGAPIWAPNGADIYWATGDRTNVALYSVQVATDEVLRHGSPSGANSQFQLSPDGGRWVWVHANPAHPSELYTAPSDDLSQATRLTTHNAWLAETFELAEARPITWSNSDGEEIEGVMHFPFEFREGRRYPLIVNPHGGPSGAVTTSFNTTNQLLAANGFLVFQPNFRGSSNYGQEFLNANRENWGISDYDDIMTGVDDIIARGWADPDRMVAYGWSYGGYMTFWMSTQTDRFKLISPGAGLTNLYSMYSTTDIPGYMAWFFGTPWDDEDAYRRHSPIRHVKNVTSKILIMHGADDARVPPEQAVEFYQALRDLGKDVTYVSYPRQGHGISEPRLQMDRLRRYVCAFTDAVGMDAATEDCDVGVPASSAADDEGDDAQSVGDTGSAASDEGLETGIYGVSERWE
jgi:dipeptidyl aminopeptidase/acylaminoacyl peptidase